MKIRRLAETDVANACLLPEDEIRKFLLAKLEIAVGYSLDPIRKLIPDFMNEVGDLLTGQPIPQRTPYDVIKKRLLALCRSTEEFGKNVEVGNVLDIYFAEENPVSRRLRIGSLTIGIGEHVNFWLPDYYVSGGIPVVTYFDPRGSGGLTPSGRTAVFAFQHHGIRSADPDFHEARLRILQVPRSQLGYRYKRVIDYQGEPLASFDELNDGVRSVYRIWSEVQAEKDRVRPPRKAAPGQGNLF